MSYLLTGIAGDRLWACTASTGKAVVWDQVALEFRPPTAFERKAAIHTGKPLKEPTMPRLTAKKIKTKAAKAAKRAAPKREGRGDLKAKGKAR